MSRRDPYRPDLASSGYAQARTVGRPRAGGLIMFWLFAALFGLMGLAIAGTSEHLSVPIGIAFVVVLVGVLVRTVRHARVRQVWRCVASGRSARTLRGRAVQQQRTVSGREMRTVVVEEPGAAWFLHLLFAEEVVARRVAAGPVTVDLFDGSKVRGPARLTAPDGTVLWAFAAKQGRAADSPDAPGAGSRGAGGRTDRERGGSADVASWSVAGTALSPDPVRSDDDGRPDGWQDDGWQGGTSWGGDPGWSGSDGSSGSDGGWGWGGGDSGGFGGGDSGGGGGGGD